MSNSRFNNKKSWFIDELRKKEVQTPSDVDDASVEIVESLRDDPDFSHFKEVAFEHGIEVEVLYRACAIWLRDEAIREFLPH